ncbi:AAA family ATPase [Pseudonocardia sp. KRD291]|uniref:MinD/ParA family ATP-binding protein n=1 Tax=Pseudonocardia sp. KRD291 TaxID=2792007 RepID=UPI0035B474EF
MSEPVPDEQPDGSVGRYVRERWGAAEPQSRPRRRLRRAGGPGTPAGPGGSERPPERGSAATGTRTPPGGLAWGAELPDVDDDLVSEIDPSTPPSGLDLSAVRAAAPPQEAQAPTRRQDRESREAAARAAEDEHEQERARAQAEQERARAAREEADRARAAREAGAAESARRAQDSAPVTEQTADDAVAQVPPARGPEPDDSPGVVWRRSVARRPSPSARPAPDGDPAAGAVPPSDALPSGPAGNEPRPGTDRAAATAEAPEGSARASRASRAERARWTAPEAVETRDAQRRRSENGGMDVDLASARLLRTTRRPPRTGWRRAVYVLSRGYLNPGESPADVRERELTVRVNKPLLSAHKIAMLSLKGGVGKTTITATLGATFASQRGDRVVAVDANPDRGTLSQKIPLETTATVRHLLRDSQRVRRYTDVRAYTSQGSSRLEVLASEQDPAVSEAFSEGDYRQAVDLLEHFYNLVLTDCGTGLMHSAMYGVLGMADQLVIVSSGSIDGARSASATLDWLDAHGNGDLVRNAVVVINTVHRRAGSGVDLDRVAEHFAGRCRAVVRVPFDGHLEEGAEIDLDRLEPHTRTALLELAASVADGFPS